MLNSQPLGFYSASQLVQDAQRHGVEVRPPDVMHSNVDCTLEGLPHPPAVRLGLRLIDKLKSASAERIVQARAEALMSLSGHRRQQVWDASALRSTPLLQRGAPVEEDLLELPSDLEGEEVVWDYASLGLTVRSYPLALLRPQLDKKRLLRASDLLGVADGNMVRYCGIETLRQQPETAKGTIFISLEDETGVVQVICWKSVRETQRKDLLNSRLLAVYGRWQREGAS